MDKDTLLSYMPGYYKTSQVIDNLNNTNAVELNRLNEKLDSVLNQFFVNTADFTLERWEKELGIEVNNNYNPEFRRSRILSKIRGQGTVTINLIKSVSESFSNGEVDITENTANYSFIVKFVGTLGIPPNMNDLIATINEIKPAHLNFTFEYSYITWNEFESYNHSWDGWDGLNLTWDEFETHREVI